MASSGRTAGLRRPGHEDLPVLFLRFLFQKQGIFLSQNVRTGILSQIFIQNRSVSIRHAFRALALDRGMAICCALTICYALASCHRIRSGRTLSHPEYARNPCRRHSHNQHTRRQHGGQDRTGQLPVLVLFQLLSGIQNIHQLPYALNTVFLLHRKAPHNRFGYGRTDLHAQLLRTFEIVRKKPVHGRLWDFSGKHPVKNSAESVYVRPRALFAVGTVLFLRSVTVL